MVYNIHPIIVHFPVALLFVYSVLKVLPFKKWFPTVSWTDIERTLLFVGVGGAFFALGTGETAQQLTKPNRNLVEMHSFFASLSTWVYSVLLLGEISSLINSKNYFKGASLVFLFLEKIFFNKYFSTSLAIIGIITISITGMLGGVLAYGLTTDPFAPLLLKFLNINL